MFDKIVRGPKTGLLRTPHDGERDDERVALRCARRELDLIDSLVDAGRFESRSALMREALRAFLREQALPTRAPAFTSEAPDGLQAVPVRLRVDEVEMLSNYCGIASNGQALEDLLAQLVRRGELELKIAETVARSRASVKSAAEARRSARELGDSAAGLERRGVVGR